MDAAREESLTELKEISDLYTTKRRRSCLRRVCRVRLLTCADH